MLHTRAFPPNFWLPLALLLLPLLAAAPPAEIRNPKSQIPNPKSFDFTPLAREAYFQATSLRFEAARRTLGRLAEAEPDNLAPLLIENYLDFFTVFLDEDKTAFKRIAKNMAARLSKIGKGDPGSPYFLYAMAETRLQMAILHGKFGEYLTAISETKQAYALLEENRRKFPGFVATQKSLGILHALVGNIPDEYRWAVRWFGGMDGSIETGLAEVEEVIGHARKTPGFLFGEESLVAYSFLLLHLGNQSEAAWKMLNSGGLNPKENPLAAFALANLAMKIGRNDEAVRLLENCPTGAEFHPFHYRNFMLGLAKLQRLDPDAGRPLEEFLGKFKGMYGIKEAYQKLAWSHLIAGNTMGYKSNIAQIPLRGADRFEPDKAALREAKSGEMPDPLLLKARLLFDGGYHARAHDLLKNAAARFLDDPKKLLEHNYRMGRIAHRLGHPGEAEQFYRQTIEGGKNEPWYFAASAALQLGLLHEEQKNRPAARAAYRQCLDLEPEEYAAGLHAKAKAGLNRLGK